MVKDPQDKERCSEDTMNLRAAIFLCLILPVIGFAASPVSEAVWHGDDSCPEGAGWSFEVLSSDPSGSRLLLECPGFWTQEVEVDGEIYTKVILPQAGILTEAGLPALPAVSKILAVPDDRDVEVIVSNVIYQTFSCVNPLPAEPDPETLAGFATPPPQGVYPENWAEALPPAIFKDYRVSQVNLFPIRYDFNERRIQLATRLEVEIRTTKPTTVNVKTYTPRYSDAFAPLYDSLIDNIDEFNTASPLVGEGPRGGYLIVADDRVFGAEVDSLVNVFATWKRELGYDVTVLLLSEIGGTREEIQDAVKQVYYGGDVPLDYVLLIGDIDGQINIPAYSIVKPTGGEQDVTDHPYAMLEGDDYFPDVMIGRISVTSTAELATALWKTTYYQRYPDVAGTDWLKEACVVAGNYSDVGIAPITPVWTSMWLVDKLYDHGYAQVDTFFWWTGNPNPPYPGNDLIAESINDGVGLVAYRGWADANGWQYPVFKVEDVEALSNGAYLPIVVSMVCNTGDFGNLSVDPCFGESWLRTGSQFNLKGGAAFFGPSDLHTNTKWNNALYAGFFEGVLEENLTRIGQAAIRAKFELYYGFPENTGVGDFAEFYFHVYNILGDPELSVRTAVPQILTLDLPAGVSLGRQTVTAEVRTPSGDPVSGAYVAFYKDDEISAGGVTSSDGTVMVEIEPLSEGEITVTASTSNCVPVQLSINAAVGSFPLGISEVEAGTGGALPAGETSTLTVTLTNFGATDLSGVQAELSADDPYVAVEQSQSAVGVVEAGGDAEASFTVSVSPDCPQNHVIEFTLFLEDDQAQSAQVKFLTPVGGLLFMPAGVYFESGSAEPGSSAQLRLLVTNAGTSTADQLMGTLTCNDGAVSVIQGESSFPVLLPGAVAAGATVFGIEVDSGARVGRQVILDLELTAGDYSQVLNFPLQLGQPASTDPLGPDSYGYFAYDDTDADYAEAPTFEWIELDSAYGGEFDTLYQLGDDKSTVIELPFTFRYYGVDYDSITVCSNGWVSMGSTWMANFRNWNLPSALGPPALIAAFWDDLKADTTGGNSSINVFTRYDESEGRLVIEWSRCINRFGYENYGTWKEETFEIVLYDPAEHLTATGDGEILFQYLVVNDVDDNNNYATVGIEDEAHRRGLQIAYSNDYPTTMAHLADGRAVKITTDPPDAFGKTADAPSGGTGGVKLYDPLPNPANPSASVRFFLPRDGQVRLDVYNLQGRLLATLADGAMEAGDHLLRLRGDDFSSGIYFLRLRYNGSVMTKKLLILK